MTTEGRCTVASLALVLTACGQSLKQPDKGRDAGRSFDGPTVTDARIPSDATPDGGCVPAGSVIFRMQASAVDGGRFYARSLGNPGDGVWWYSLAKADGTPVQVFLDQSTTCDDCREVPVPIGFSCTPLPDGGVTGGWDGIAMNGIGRCLDSSRAGQPVLSVLCDETTCMPSGRYVVTMCADCVDARHPPDGGDACVSVPFDYPGSAEVVGTL